jgi:hypothetical protein
MDEQFDELLYQFMIQVAALYGKDFREYASSEYLEDLRTAIKYTSAIYWLNLKEE